MNAEPSRRRTPASRGMPARRRLALALACLVATFPPAALAQTQPTSAPATQPTPPADAKLGAALAERFALAADGAASPDADPASLRAAAAMLELARQNAPDEPRFARASADVLMRLGDRERAIAALVALRAIQPDDQLAMIQFVDLTLAGLETADGRIAYAQQIAKAEGVPVEVRSHAAQQLADVFLQRGQDAEAVAAVDLAVSLNPQNATALESQYGLRSRMTNAKSADRVQSLRDLIVAAPADPQHLIAMSGEAVRAGSYEEASLCYRLAFAIANGYGQRPSLEEVLDAGAAELMAGRADVAGLVAGQAKVAAPTDGRFYTLDLLAGGVAGAKPDDQRDAIAAARGVYLAQLAGVSTLLNEPAATTLPATNPAPAMPNVGADVAKLAASGDPQRLATGYAVALSELVWFDLYFKAAPIEDSTMAAVRQLLGDSDPIVVPVRGMATFERGQAGRGEGKVRRRRRSRRLRQAGRGRGRERRQRRGGGQAADGGALRVQADRALRRVRGAGGREARPEDADRRHGCRRRLARDGSPSGGRPAAGQPARPLPDVGGAARRFGGVRRAGAGATDAAQRRPTAAHDRPARVRERGVRDRRAGPGRRAQRVSPERSRTVGRSGAADAAAIE